MKAVELLETYPRAAEVINEFYHTKMIESMNTEDVPQEYKDLLKEQEFDNEYVAKFIDANPRILFDVFDSNAVYIEILVDYSKNDAEFTYGVIDDDEMNTESTIYNSRVEAEKVAIEKAFQLLNDKL
jgi:hypothetical protein